MPLMGWLSSADMLPILEEKLRFDTLEQAIAFAERNGMNRFFFFVHRRILFSPSLHFLPDAFLRHQV